MSELIRKISIGPNYKDCMVYSVGQTIMKGTHEISAINRSPEDPSVVQIWIKNLEEEESYLWKSISNMPMAIEHNISF